MIQRYRRTTKKSIAFPRLFPKRKTEMSLGKWWVLLKLHEYFLVWGLIWENKELDWGWSCVVECWREARWTGTLVWNTHLSPLPWPKEALKKKNAIVCSQSRQSPRRKWLWDEEREKSQRELQAWKDKWPAFKRVHLVLKMWQGVMRKTKRRRQSRVWDALR